MTNWNAGWPFGPPPSGGPIGTDTVDDSEPPEDFGERAGQDGEIRLYLGFPTLNKFGQPSGWCLFSTGEQAGFISGPAGAASAAPPAPDSLVYTFEFYDLDQNPIFFVTDISIPYADFIASATSANAETRYAFWVSVLNGDGLLAGSDDDDPYLEVGEGGTVTVDAGAGRDTLYVWHQKDVIYDGGPGSDTLVFNTSTGSTASAPAGAAVDLMAGTATNPFGGTLTLTSVENVAGTDQADSITGTDGPNVIGDTGFEGGADTINALGGDDVVKLGPSSAQVSVDGGDGFDEIQFQVSPLTDPPGAPAVLDLLNPGLNTGTFAGGFLAGFESFVPLNFTGTVRSFTFGGSDGPERVSGGGNDLLLGRGGNDTLFGGGGNDSIDGGDGDDLLVGSIANATLNGGDGFDTLDLGAFFPGVTVDLAAGTATGGGLGNLTLLAIERAIGTVANDSLTGSDDANLLEGGIGNDTFNGGLGNDTLVGSAAVQGAGSQDVDVAIFPGNRASYDIVFANGVALVTGPAGSDTTQRVELLQFDDQTVEVPPVVTIVSRSLSEGDVGNKTVLFSVALSAVPAATVNVTVTPVNGTAVEGVDYLAATTVLTFPAGQRFVNYPVTYVGDTLVEGDETFTLALSDPVNAMVETSAFGTGTIQDDDTGATFTGTAANDTLIGAIGPDTLFGMEGDDLISGGDGADVILGNEGDDTINGDGGNDIITGDLGAAPGNDLINAGAGNDTILVQDGSDTVEGSTGDDLIGVFAGTNSVLGGNGNDVVLLGGGTSIVDGGNANDIFGVLGGDGHSVLGGAGDDVFFGGGTNATLEGGAGNDVFLAGPGADTFAYQDGFGPIDLIYGFGQGSDMIRLAANINGTGIAAPNDVLSHIGATTLDGVGPASAISLGPEIIYVVGLQALQASDFVIG